VTATAWLRTESARPDVVRRHPRAPWFAVAAVCFGAFLGQLDASIVTLALPALQRDFHVGLASAQWVSLSYLVVLVALVVPVGRWSDRAGRKLVYLYGFVLFTAASAGCGLAGSLGLLVALRAVQAVGAAMLQANSVALVSSSVPPNRRRTALGIQAGAQAVGLALGPTVGGLVVATAGWRWIFWLAVPVGAAAVLAGWFLLPRTRDRRPPSRPDVAGVVLLAAAASSILLATSAGSGLSADPALLSGTGAVALVALAVLWWWERRAPVPLIDPAVLGRPGVRSGLAGALAAYLVLFGPLVLFPQLAGGSAAGAGLALTALPAGFGLAAVLAGRVLPSAWSDRRRCLAGAGLAVAAALALTLPVPPAARIVLLGVLGLGLGTYIPANNATIMSAIPSELAATAGGLVNMARGLGTAGGVALVPLALYLAGGGASVPVRTATAMAALAAVTIAMAVLAGVSRPRAGARNTGRDTGG